MVKELRTQQIELRLHRPTKLDASQWKMVGAQPFFPPLEHLFKTERLTSMSEYGIRFPEEVESIESESTIVTSKRRKLEIHRKTTMLLSPFKTIKGEYVSPDLPKPSDVAKDIASRLQSPHTAAYVGALASSVLSLSGCSHFPAVYGVYAALAKEHTLDISDDYEDIHDRKWFIDNVGKTFDLKMRPVSGETFTHTRGQRAGLMLGEETELDVEDVAADHVENPTDAELLEEYELSEHTSEADDSTYEEDVYDIESCQCADFEDEDDDEEEEEDDDDDEEPFAWATFKDVPVLTTVMEKCEGTFYGLIEKDTDVQHQTAFVAQLMMALAFAQRMFGFVHNDLHGNNVMYISTTQTHLYYKVGGQCYCIPTYGVLIKVIDFDRAGLSVRLTGMKDPRFFLSSQFQEDEEAAGQYNIEPFYNSKHPRIPLSASFDLTRFATSVFWDMFPEGPDHAYDHPLFEMFKHWMTVPDGSSVLYRASHDNHDRYHDFDLYKAIARHCQNGIPRREISKLKAFLVPKVPVECTFLVVEP